MKRPQSELRTDDTPQLKKAKRAPEAEIQEPRLDMDLNSNDTSNAEEGWTKVEKRKMKKVKKAETKDTHQPRFMYSNGEIIKRRHAIGVEEIRDLVLHLIADAPPPNWLRIDNPHQIHRVVTLLIPGLTSPLLSLPPLPTSATQNPNLPLPIPLPSQLPQGAAAIPFIGTTFSHACPTRAPGDQMRMHSVLSTFFNVPVSGEERKRRATERVFSQGIQCDPSKYMLSLEQMVENDYPIPSYMADIFEKPSGWVETPPPVEGTGKRAIYAIDCEMCLTEDGKELTRVSIIDYHTNLVIYDTLVKPAKPITDYLTRWSGITAAHLQHTTTTHSEVQAHIMSLLSPKPNPFSPAPITPPTPILLGHSLESDLKALKIAHPYCIDTALIYHHPRGRPLKPGLAWLTKKWCGREIQCGEGGHDPREDAQACVDLLKRKVVEGPGFGEFKTDVESIFERVSRAGGVGGKGGERRCAVVDHGNPGVMHGSKATTAIGCTDDEGVLEGLIGAVGSHKFIFGRFMRLAGLLGWTTPKAASDAPPPPPSPPPTEEELKSVLKTLDGQLKALHAALPPKTALVIFTGHSDPRRMASLGARKMRFEGMLKAGLVAADGVKVDGAEGGEGEIRWTSADARELEEAVEVAKRGLVFLGIKQ